MVYAFPVTERAEDRDATPRRRARQARGAGRALARAARSLAACAALAPLLAAPQSLPPAGPGSATDGEPPASAMPSAASAAPLPAAEVSPYMRHLGRELRVLVRDTPVELEASRGDGLRLRLPAAWLFRMDDVVVRPEALVHLDALALALASPSGARTLLEVAGHCDSLGRREPNRAFTLRRAESVAALLAGRGVAPARLATRGAGEDERLEKDETTPAARRRNRRIEIEIRPSRPSRREAS
ncbi:MAG: OmpA family protein [Steroidobacteraceae bacterium]|nr:OmpA family protein [Steroidobacteraceae bacterium]